MIAKGELYNTEKGFSRLPRLQNIHRGNPSHTSEQNMSRRCDNVQQKRTNFLSIRVTQGFDAFLKVVADEFGVSKSTYARWVLVQELKRQKARYHVLGWDRQRMPHPQVGNQYSAPPA
jgi:hypothetical protein